MSIEKMIRVLAGTMVLVSILLTLTVSEYWLLLSSFVSLNLVQSAFTDLYPAEKILKMVFPC